MPPVVQVQTDFTLRYQMDLLDKQMQRCWFFLASAIVGFDLVILALRKSCEGALFTQTVTTYFKIA